MANFNMAFRGRFEFVTSAADMDGIPKRLDAIPEIAFIGRSNVGKSSIINALTGQKLAFSSKTPGRTRLLNFFTDKGGRLTITDMPGYGYARLSGADMLKIQDLIFSYLTMRHNLKRIFLLIDSRHAIKGGDSKIMRLLDHHGVAYQMILTKCDKVSREDLRKLLTNIKDQSINYPAMYPEIIAVSAIKKYGMDDLKKEIMGLLKS